MADDKPVEQDIRHDDLEFNPSLEPRKAKAWLNLLQESEDAFERYNDHCDRIDKQYASLERLSNMARDKEFQMFWANAEVIKPSIYAKAPVPVVVAKFLDRRPVYQAAAELMQRCCTVAFDLAGIDELMKLVRDDLALLDRGVAWVRYESARSSYYDSERVCIDFKHRRDFLHGIARNWREVPWVAAASYLTRSEARDRFHKYSGDAYQDAEYKVDRETREIGGTDNRERAKFWEIWSKGDRRVVWVAQGCEDILDEDDPHLDLREFFPCPKPAYGTVQRGSLVPVPDVMQYKDQLEELNLLTGRIHALSDALEAKGFYPAGGAEIADAVQAAIAIKTPGRVLVPISNWAAFGGSKDVIIWLPIDMIAQCVTGLVALRKEIIQDIYQIMGLSDIMRGATDPNETLGAQQMKTEYGGTRIQDKQAELVRLARDLVEISSEIITEKFTDATMIEMSQTQLPTRAEQNKQVTDITEQMQSQARQAAQSPQGRQMLRQNPQQAQQVLQQAMQAGQDAIRKVMAKPTIEQVLTLLKDNRMKSFVLDIETDSTIMPDENAEKQRRTEFVGVLSQLLPQLSQMIMAAPETASFCGAVLKFATAPFRAGRALDGAIDELTELMKEKGQQPQRQDPATMQAQTAMQIEQMKLTYAKQKDDADRQVKVMEVQGKNQAQMASSQTDAQAKAMEVQGRQQESQAKLQQIQVESAADAQEHQQRMQADALKAQFANQKHAQAMEAAAAKATHFDQMAQDRRAQQQFKAMQPPPQRGPV